MSALRNLQKKGPFHPLHLLVTQSITRPRSLPKPQTQSSSRTISPQFRLLSLDLNTSNISAHNPPARQAFYTSLTSPPLHPHQRSACALLSSLLLCCSLRPPWALSVSHRHLRLAFLVVPQADKLASVVNFSCNDPETRFKATCDEILRDPKGCGSKGAADGNIEELQGSSDGGGYGTADWEFVDASKQTGTGWCTCPYPNKQNVSYARQVSESSYISVPCTAVRTNYISDTRSASSDEIFAGSFAARLACP